MGANSGAYKFVFVLHILSVVVGFGVLFLAPAFATTARKRGAGEGAVVSQVLTDVIEHWAEWFIYAVFILGILLVLMSDDTFKFSQAWVGTSMLLYIVVVGLLQAVHLPTLRRINVLAAELNAGPGGAAAGRPPAVGELEALEKKAAAVGGIVSLLVVGVIFLMVFKPGL